MTGAGRLTGEVGWRTRRLIYGEFLPSDLSAELALQTRVDEAHLLMLAEQGLVSFEAAGGLLACIAQLREQATGRCSAGRHRAGFT